MHDIAFRAIGVIHSDFTKQEGTPVQSALAGDAKGWIEVDEAWAPALKDLAEFERIWVLYHLDRSGRWSFPIWIPLSTASSPRVPLVGPTTSACRSCAWFP